VGKDLIPVVSIVGRKNSGKTTFIEGLIPVFIKKGYRVGTIKHDAHHFEIDREGKDSWRHKKAGAHTVVISSEDKLALVRDCQKQLTLHEIIIFYMKNVDIVITEGFKRDKGHKIEIWRGSSGDAPVLQNDSTVIAVVTDRDHNLKIPSFYLNDYEGVAHLIEKKIFNKEQ
jgi:molybdopterin-guanine dinucleotide biosynthesis protein B